MTRKNYLKFKCFHKNVLVDYSHILPYILSVAIQVLQWQR